MTWSLRLENGDLTKEAGSSLDIIQGPDKVIQDLLCWIKEPYGTDPLNPELGSFIDSGEEGTVLYANGEVGYFSNDYSQLVVSEIKRIINEYQLRQTTRLRLELQKYNGLYTFSDNELIERFNIFYQNNYDTVFITIDLEMVSGDLYRLEVPVAANSTVLEGNVF